jgi:hypothetical protein
MYIWSGAAGPQSTQGTCTIRATMNGDVIGSFDWEGTESQCANYALMLSGPDLSKRHDGRPTLGSAMPVIIQLWQRRGISTQLAREAIVDLQGRIWRLTH